MKSDKFNGFKKNNKVEIKNIIPTNYKKEIILNSDLIISLLFKSIKSLLTVRFTKQMTIIKQSCKN